MAGEAGFGVVGVGPWWAGGGKCLLMSWSLCSGGGCCGGGGCVGGGGGCRGGTATPRRGWPSVGSASRSVWGGGSCSTLGTGTEVPLSGGGSGGCGGAAAPRCATG